MSIWRNAMFEPGLGSLQQSLTLGAIDAREPFQCELQVLEAHADVEPVENPQASISQAVNADVFTAVAQEHDGNIAANANGGEECLLSISMPLTGPTCVRVGMSASAFGLDDLGGNHGKVFPLPRSYESP